MGRHAVQNQDLRFLGGGGAVDIHAATYSPPLPERPLGKILKTFPLAKLADIPKKAITDVFYGAHLPYGRPMSREDPNGG